MATTSPMDVTAEGKYLLEFVNVSNVKQSHILATTNTFVDKDIQVTAVAAAGSHRALNTTPTNSVVTPKLSNLHANAVNTYGFITSLPSGTTLNNGTNYLLIDPDAEATAWSITPRSQISTAGYLATGTVDGTEVSQTPTINAGTSYYIPIVTPTVEGGELTPTNFNKTDLTITLGAGTTAANRNMENYSVGAKNTSTYPYYFEIVGSTPAVSETTTVSRGAITLTNNAGVIAANSGNVINSTSSSLTVSVNATNGSIYFNLKKAQATISVSTEAPAITKITKAVSGKSQILSNVDPTTGTGTISTYYIAIKGESGAVTQTPSITTKGYLGSTSEITANGITAANQTSTYYIPVPSAATPTLTITDKTTAVTVGSLSNGSYPISTSLTGKITVGTAGWLPTTGLSATDSSVKVGIMAPATFIREGAVIKSDTAGYIPADTIIETVSSGTIIAVNSDPGNGYTEITQNVTIATGGYLQIGAGYYSNSKISLATLVPDEANIPYSTSSPYILNTYTAYDINGNLITGGIPTYQGTFT